MLFAPSDITSQKSGIGPSEVKHSLIIPVFRNEENIPDLLQALQELGQSVPGLEVVFVIDGSPDNSAAVLAQGLTEAHYAWQLIELSRNFGSFAAIRQGLALASGRYFAVMAADLQEPPDLIEKFFLELDNDSVDLVVGVRTSRADPPISKLFSRFYWHLYRTFVMNDIPAGGVDVFGCNLAFREALLSLEERSSFLIGQLFWLGFRRQEIAYERRARTVGVSAWKFQRRFRYMLDNVFAFSDLPINLLLWFGVLGTIVAGTCTVIITSAWILGFIAVRGYMPIMLAIIFFGSLLILGQGIIGCYIWRVAENTKKRPLSIVLSHRRGPSVAASSIHGLSTDDTHG
jgi:glycosyltransferase involved in cell wall biosynthesis